MGAFTGDLRDTVANVIAGFSGQQAVLVIPRVYLSLLDNDHGAALFLSQCVYWSDRTNDPEGWFAKSYEDWFAELGLTKRQLGRIIKALEPLGLETSVRRSSYYNGGATLHYRIDRGVFTDLLMRFCSSNKSQKVTNVSDKKEPTDGDKMSRSVHRVYTENTTEIKESTFVSEGKAQNVTNAESEAVEWVNGDEVEDAKPTLYPADERGVNALITAWWDWVPARPVKNGAVIDAKAHYGNATNRQCAERMMARGIGPADVVRALAALRAKGDEPKPMTFTYAAAIIEDYVKADTRRCTYTKAVPRLTARKPDAAIEFDANATWAELEANPNLYVDVPRPYISPQVITGGAS